MLKHISGFAAAASGVSPRTPSYFVAEGTEGSRSLYRRVTPPRTLLFLKETDLELDRVLDYLRRETMAALTERS